MQNEDGIYSKLWHDLLSEMKTEAAVRPDRSWTVTRLVTELERRELRALMDYRTDVLNVPRD